jgi:Transposase IS4
MTLADDPDNDARVGPLLCLNMSQESQSTLPDIQGEGMSAEPVVVDASLVTVQATESEQENPPENAVADTQVPAPPIVPKPKRNTKSFANMYLLANMELFLDHLYCDQFDDPSVLIVGQVKECAREANGKRYRIEWKNAGMPLPAGLEAKWLATYLPATKRDALYAAIERYAACPTSEGMKKPGRKKKQSEKPAGPPTVAATDVAVTPVPPLQEIDAMAAAASIRTSSTISTLSQSTIASPEAVVPTPMAAGLRSTRSTVDVESASDDGDDLDEEDNIYAEDSSASDDSECEVDDEDDNTITASVSGRDAEGGISRMLEEILWNFVLETSFQDDDAPSPYDGPSGLKPRVAHSFTDPFECLGACGGLDYEFVCRLARNSNEYAKRHLCTNDRNRRLHGQPFKNITTEEMYHFLGITLRISLSPVDWGGYEAYFATGNKVVLDVEIPGTEGFAKQYMSLIRYKQIRSAFHPEDRASGAGGDKCYQLRHAINTMNAAAKNVKYLGENLTFDEGGIGSRHRLNPVRQYNKDKPAKFRVDFFIMACSVSYFIHHLDVYQGANAKNVAIHRAARDLPTTQKAVLNAVLATEMHKEVNGARHLAMDNRYQCPELALILRQKFKIMSSGTCRKNRKGWNKDLMNLEKKDGRGTYKFSVDKSNKIVCCQWVDSKVVNCVSSCVTSEVEEVKRQVGSTKKTFPCPVILRRYQKTMMGVDKSDQMRALGGFASKAHYKKWYKRAFFAILDMMTLNAYIVWNLSCKDPTLRGRRSPLKRHEYLWYISQRMLDFKDDTSVDNDNERHQQITSIDLPKLDGHVPTVCNEQYKRCIVCRLDFNVLRMARREKGGSADDNKVSQKSICRNLAACPKCKITAHSMVLAEPRKIHDLDEFKGMTCFQIAHTNQGYQIWKRVNDNKKYHPNMTHPICEKLRKVHGLEEKQARKRKRESTDDDNRSTSS